MKTSDIEGMSFMLNEGEGLSDPIDCGIIPYRTDVNGLVQFTWKHNNSSEILTYSRGNKPAIYQVYEGNRKRLYIQSANAAADGLYSCHYTWRNGTSGSKSFTLNVTGISRTSFLCNSLQC